MYVCLYSLRVSGSHVPIIRRINCINTTYGICHSVQITIWRADLDLIQKELCIRLIIYKDHTEMHDGQQKIKFSLNNYLFADACIASLWKIPKREQN
jgi:hypothetical protein